MRKSYHWLKLRFDRILSQDILRQVIILVGFLFVVFLISFLLLSLSGDDWVDYCKDHHISKWVFPLYLLIDGNAFNNFYVNEKIGGGAVFMACLIYVAGVVIFTGMIISVMTNMIERRVENYREGRIHYLKSGHYIVMGYDDMVPSMITDIIKRGDYVLILSSAQAENIREKLSRSFTQKQLKQVIINYGHRTSQEPYKDIHLESAAEIFVVGYHSKPEHDAINVECVDSIRQYLEQCDATQRPRRITCVFKDLDTYAAFKTSNIFRKVSDLGIEFVPYNYFAGWAKQVFVKREYRDFENPEKTYKYPAVYGDGIRPDDERFVHLVFVGTTNFAVAFAMEAAHVLHFPNADKAKTRITFIDKNADKEKDEFIIRYRHFFEVQSYYYYDLSKDSSGSKKEPEGLRDENVVFTGSSRDFLDVEFEFIKGDVFSQPVQERIAQWAQEHKRTQYFSIFLALADQRQNFVMSMNMPDDVYDKEIPVFIRQDHSDNFITNLRNGVLASVRYDETYSKAVYSSVVGGNLQQEPCDVRYANIYPFGMNETAYSDDNHSLRRAMLINFLYATADYSCYKFQSIEALSDLPVEKIWFDAKGYWRNLSVALKWSNLYSAYAMRTKLATLHVMRGLAIDNRESDFNDLNDKEVEYMARVEHNRWNVEKLLMGYRKARPEEDKYLHAEFANQLGQNKQLFIHSDIRPFDELDAIREFDKEFSKYIPWIMKMTETNDGPDSFQ